MADRQYILNRETLIISGPFTDVDRYELHTKFLICPHRQRLEDIAAEIRAEMVKPRPARV